MIHTRTKKLRKCSHNVLWKIGKIFLKMSEITLLPSNYLFFYQIINYSIPRNIKQNTILVTKKEKKPSHEWIFIDHST